MGRQQEVQLRRSEEHAVAVTVVVESETGEGFFGRAVALAVAVELELAALLVATVASPTLLSVYSTKISLRNHYYHRPLDEQERPNAQALTAF